MNTQSKRSALVVAVLVAGVGLVVGLWPHSVPLSGDKSFSCGSAFGTGGDDPIAAGYGRALSRIYQGQAAGDSTTELRGECSDAVSGPRTFAFVLIGLAAIAAVGVGLVRADQARAV